MSCVKRWGTILSVRLNTFWLFHGIVQVGRIPKSHKAGKTNKNPCYSCSKKLSTKKSTKPTTSMTIFHAVTKSSKSSNDTSTKDKKSKLSNSTDFMTVTKVSQAPFPIIRPIKLFLTKNKGKILNSMNQMSSTSCVMYIQRVKRSKHFKWFLLNWSVKSPPAKAMCGWAKSKDR